MGLSLNLLEYEIKKLTEALRPPIDIRDQLDIGYKFQNQTLEIFEIRPRWNDQSIIDQHSFAKAKFIKSKSIWRIYWLRANGNWELYKPIPEVQQISEFFKAVDEDKHNAFKG
jgi:Protein of unknown function (DUF3024)